MTRSIIGAAGLAAVVLAGSVSGAAAGAGGSAGECFVTRDGFRWNLCTDRQVAPKKQEAAAANPAAGPGVPARPRVSRSRGIFGMILPAYVPIETDHDHPGDRFGGNDGGGGAGGNR